MYIEPAYQKLEIYNVRVNQNKGTNLKSLRKFFALSLKSLENNIIPLLAEDVLTTFRISDCYGGEVPKIMAGFLKLVVS